MGRIAPRTNNPLKYATRQALDESRVNAHRMLRLVYSHRADQRPEDITLISLPTLSIVGTTAAPSPTHLYNRELELLRGIPEDFEAMPMLSRFADVVPIADLVLGGGVLILVVLIHGAGLRGVNNHVGRRVDAILRHPSAWHADLLMGSIIFLLLALHLFEVFAWSAALVGTGLVNDWRAAGFFAGNTYTTIGYGNFILPLRYQMLAPIMAISGLFTFGWSGSMLVDYVRRIQQIRDAANALKKPEVPKQPASR